MGKKVIGRGALGALLAAWWAEKQSQKDITLSLYDVCILAGLGLAWALERWQERR